VNGKNHCSDAVTVTRERQRRPAAIELASALFERRLRRRHPVLGEASERAVAPQARLSPPSYTMRFFCTPSFVIPISTTSPGCR
jgi:hypothetical protein